MSYTSTDQCLRRLNLRYSPGFKICFQSPRYLRAIYQSATLEEAEQALLDFAEKWDERYPMISQSWWRHWEHVTPFFQFSNDIRRVIYSTNAIESLNSCVRRIIKTKGSFPNEEAVFKLVFLGSEPRKNWKEEEGVLK